MLLLSLQTPARYHQLFRNPPPDDNIHRFNELLDMIAGPANATDYQLQPQCHNVPPIVPTHSNVVLDNSESLNVSQANHEEEYTMSQSDSEEEWNYGREPAGRGAQNFMARYCKLEQAEF